jgi:hypothetical protein
VTEKAVVKLNSTKEFQEYWRQTLAARRGYEKQHEAGLKKYSKKSQSLAASIKVFLNDVQPILDIIQGFASPWGNLAVGTIFMLCYVRT